MTSADYQQSMPVGNGADGRLSKKRNCKRFPQIPKIIELKVRHCERRLCIFNGSINGNQFYYGARGRKYTYISNLY